MLPAGFPCPEPATIPVPAVPAVRCHLRCNAVEVRRYWIEFKGAVELRPHAPLDLGVGVTAWSVDHAVRMVKWAYGPPLPTVAHVVENVDVSLLGLPSWALGVPVWPGIWQPPLNLWFCESEWPS